VFNEQPGHLLEAIWTLCETRRGDLWAGTASGGLRRLRDGRFTSITTQEGLSDNAVRCVFEDREQTLWVGTVGGGLNRLKERKLRTFTTRDGLTHNVVMSLSEAEDGTLWAGSNCGGLSARRNGVFSAVSANYLLDNECIWSVLPSRDGSLWIGTWGGGLFRLRGRDGEEQTRGVVENFPVIRPGDDEPVVALCETASGALWVGTMQAGLKLFRDGEWRVHAATNLPPNAITALREDSDGTLWIGTAGGGLARFKHDRITICTRQNGLPSNFIRTLFRDSKGVLWVGTGAGLARLHDDVNSAAHACRFDAFTRAEGLPDDVISQILEDGRGNLWMGCNQGIFKVSRQQFDGVAAGQGNRVNAILYGRADGMESIECTGGFHPAGARSRDGKLWFSTVKGVVMIDPETISANEVPPPVVLEEIAITTGRVGAQQTRVLPITNSLFASHAPAVEPLHLPSRLQRLELRFNGLSLVAPERNRFKYRLEGFEANWVEGAQRVATYTHLPPGRYQFHVLASNNDGVWSQAGAALAFFVAPAFWQTWWFRTLLAVIVLGGGGLLVRTLSVRRLRRKLRVLEQKHLLEQERTRIAQDIHDDLGASLTRIALLSELGQKHREEPSEIAADLSKISSTARDAVRAMDAIVWAVNPHNDSLDHFANYISHFAEDFFRLSPMHCRLDIPDELPEQPLSTEARHQLFLAVKEALNNVVRHSRATEVWLRVRCDNAELRVIIEDNGCGLPSGQPRTGHDGMANIRQRLERLGGHLDVTSEPGKGTTLAMRLSIEPRSGNRRVNGIASTRPDALGKAKH
jgi:signal transduction histidine kinase